MITYRNAIACAFTLSLLVGCGAPRAPLATNQPLRTSTKVSAKWVLKNRSPLIPGELVVEVRPGFATQQLRAFAGPGSRQIQRLRIENQEFALIEVAKPENTPQIMAQLRSNPQIQSVAPNPRYMALNTPARPISYASAQQLRRFNGAVPVNPDPAAGPQNGGLNDAFFSLQWALPKIGLLPAWNMGSQGSKAIIVAVIDSGVDYQHPDLRGQIINGLDFMAENPTGPNGEGSPDVVDDDPLDQMGHGTHVAGIIGAIPNNGTGIAGIAPGVKILNERVLNAEGWGSAFAIAQGITHAVDNGARIINLSLGSSEPSKPIELAVRYAQKKGVLVVAAAGNSYTHTGYPASYPGVLAVGATNDEDWLADFSNHDARINVVAPGVDIMSTTPSFLTNTMAQNGIDSYYSVMSGTSMACPMVSAQAALLLSHNPSLTAPQLMDIIQKTAKPVGDRRIFGHGRIQIDASLQMLASMPPAAPPANTAPPSGSNPGMDPGANPGPNPGFNPGEDISQLPAPVAAQRRR